MRLSVLCAAALFGLVLGEVMRLAPPLLALATFFGALGAWLSRGRHRWWCLGGLVTSVVALGGLRAALAPPQREAGLLEPYHDLHAAVRGSVVEPAVLTSRPDVVHLTLDVDAVAPAATASAVAAEPAPVPHADEHARLRVVGEQAQYGQVAAGEVLVLEGRLLARAGRGPPVMLFPRLLGREASAGIAPLAYFANLRAAADAGIRRYLPRREASLAVGVLLGGSAGLDPEFRARLQRSGLAHLVAIDGFKQVVVAGALGALAVRLLGARLAALPIGAGIVGYTLLTGAHPSAVRAGLMVGLSTLAGQAGRVSDSLTSLVLAATIMAAIEPRILLDVGFQLSVTATLGIVLLWRRTRRWLRRVPRVVAQPAGLTLAVTLATLPVMLSVFQTVSLVSPLAHIVAVPLLPAVLLSAALLAAVSSVEPLGFAAAWLAEWPLRLLVETTRFFGDLPGAALSTGRLPPAAAVAFGLALLAWGLWGLPEAGPLRIRWARRRRSSMLIAPATCLVSCLAATTLLQLIRPDGLLHVHVLEAGPGEAVLIRGPTGRTALIVGGQLDGGALGSQVAERLAVWEHKLDAVVRLDTAAEAGLAGTLERYPPTEMADGDEGRRVDLGAGAALDVYAAAEAARNKPSASVSFGDVWIPLVNYPPGPPGHEHESARGGEELVSDGVRVWSDPP